MADYQAILEEEFEVLESIFPEELEKVSEREVRIRIEPEDPSPSNPLVLVLVVSYPDTYPDVIPDLQVESLDEDSGELDDDEEEKFLSDLRSTAEESIGMAMTFTIASMAREALTTLIEDRITREREEDERKTRAYEEAELERTRGTPLTPDAFNTWRKSFTAELQRKREKEEEDRIKAMAPKEREEYKRRRERLTGKQLFLTSKTLATSDEALYEEGDAAVDMSKYSREEREAERRREEDEEERRRRGLVNAEDSD